MSSSSHINLFFKSGEVLICAQQDPTSTTHILKCIKNSDQYRQIHYKIQLDLNFRYKSKITARISYLVLLTILLLCKFGSQKKNITERGNSEDRSLTRRMENEQKLSGKSLGLQQSRQQKSGFGPHDYYLKIAYSLQTNKQKNPPDIILFKAQRNLFYFHFTEWCKVMKLTQNHSLSMVRPEFRELTVHCARNWGFPAYRTHPGQTYT